MKFHPSIVRTTYQSPLGSMTLAATHHGLAGLWFDGQRHLPTALEATAHAVPVWPIDPCHPVLKETTRQLTEYFAGQRDRFDLPLDLSGGTEFQQAVWRVLLEIGRGGTASYSEISSRIGKPSAMRAVGAAIGRNPVSVIVPCHRVIGSNGALTGYAGGLNRKTALLELEGVRPESLI